MSEMESADPDRFPRALRLVTASAPGPQGAEAPRRDTDAPVSFHRLELQAIFQLYGTRVAAGEWRDYALDFTPTRAVFSIFRRASEYPLYRIEKIPELARRQGMYAVVATGGLILRRGNDLPRVLRVLEKSLRVVR